MLPPSPPRPRPHHPVCQQCLPLWPVRAAMAWLGQSEPRILTWLDEGRLPWAWNIARAGSGRRELRIWHRSLAAFKQPEAVMPGADLAEDVVLAEVIGHGRSVLRAVEVCRLLNCDQATVARHLADGELAAVGPRCRRPQTGPM